MPTIHLIIKGKVQGVFYRATAKEVAESIGITGWVKNTSTGAVEVTVTGTEVQLQQFSNWCKEGPPKAKVTEVITTSHEEITFTGFTIIRD